MVVPGSQSRNVRERWTVPAAWDRRYRGWARRVVRVGDLSPPRLVCSTGLWAAAAVALLSAAVSFVFFHVLATVFATSPALGLATTAMSSWCRLRWILLKARTYS
jgi:hypothetical protein